MRFKSCKKKDQNQKGRCDSFVVKTNVHFPTDNNLLFDAMRKIITLTAKMSKKFNISGWRQYSYNIRQLKKLMRKIQKLRHSTSKNPDKIQQKTEEIVVAYIEYTKTARSIIKKVKESQNEVFEKGEGVLELTVIDHFIKHAERQIDQITRRVVHSEKIPHQEKVFSIFQPHTEWICKGKAGVPVELGLRVAIIEDSNGFILNHKVMQKQTDDQIAISFIKETKTKFPQLYSCSFDKGFHSPKNQEELNQILDVVALPKKGKLSKKERERKNSEEFKVAKKGHSAVESAINGLEVHGLDKCPDNGIYDFERYVSLAILARNLQKIGAILIRKEHKMLKKREKHKCAA